MSINPIMVIIKSISLLKIKKKSIVTLANAHDGTRSYQYNDCNSTVLLKL